MQTRFIKCMLHQDMYYLTILLFSEAEVHDLRVLYIRQVVIHRYMNGRHHFLDHS